jgi:hypothetical protein
MFPVIDIVVVYMVLLGIENFLQVGMELNV